MLGAVLLDAVVLDDVNQLIQPPDFHLEIHRQIFEAMLRLSADRRAIDAVTLPAEMRVKAEPLTRSRPAPTSPALDSGLASAANARHYADIVRGLSLRRAVREAALKIAEISHDESLSVAGPARQRRAAALHGHPGDQSAKDLQG